MGILEIVIGITVLIFIIYIFVQLEGSRRILKWYGAKKIQRSERSLLYSILEELSKKTGTPTPEILSFESEIPAIFTVGSRRKSFISISTSLLDLFDELEIEVLLAHEIGHIKNNDVSLNTVTAFLAGAIMSFPNLILSGSMLLGCGQPEDLAPKLFRFMATALAAPPAAILIHLTNPTKREFEADETSIVLTGNSRTLAITIEYLENHISLQPVTSKYNPGHFHLFSTHTQQVRGYLSIFTALFDTHPKTEDRVAHIIKYSNNLEQGTLYSKYSRVPGYFDLGSWRLALATSLIAYLLLLFVVIAMMMITSKDARHSDVAAILVGLLIGAVLFLMGITARVSRRGYRLK